jgi:ribonuclease Z
MFTRMIIFAAMLINTVMLQGVAYAQETFRVTLLGTGTPSPNPQRFGPATLVEVGNQKLLFDAGRGVPIRLSQLRIPMARIDTLFITHYHSDHVSGIPDLWLTGWLPGGGGRKQPVRVIGPTGAKELMTNLEKAYAADVRIRIADQKLPAAGASISTEEFSSDGVVYERDDVRVTAFEVDHGDEIKPAYGYRVDYKGRSVLISGDTRFSENLIRNGMGVDLLVHAIAGSKPELLKDPVVRRILDHHTLPPQAATVFNRTKPKLAVYTHFVLQGTKTVPRVTVDEIVAETRKTYSGPLQAGEDLMSFDIMDAGVKVNPPPR